MRRRGRWLAVATGALVVTAVLAPSTQAAPGGVTTRVSVATGGGQATGGTTIPIPSINADGRFVAFHSRAGNLVTNDTNGTDDVFVHDRGAGTTVRVSIPTNAVQASGPSFFPDISADGNFVVFGSGANDLVDGDTNGEPVSPTASPEAIGRDVFVHDRAAATTERVSVNTEEGQAECFFTGPTPPPGTPAPCGGGAVLAEASISADGRYVAFAANATTLVTGCIPPPAPGSGRTCDTNGATDVFVRDRRLGTTARVSVATGGAQANGSSLEPSITADGRFVAFTSSASNLVTCTPAPTPPATCGDTNGQPDVFVHEVNRDATGLILTHGTTGTNSVGTTTRVSMATGGTQATGGSSTSPEISDDGRTVVFRSAATNLVAGDTNGADDVFVHQVSRPPPATPPPTTPTPNDNSTGPTTRVSVASGGGQANEGSFFPFISGNGRFVSFDSPASNLVPGDTNEASDAFVHDRETGETSRVSVTSAGVQANGNSFFTALNRDGRFVAFSSDASNLVPGDSNEAPDVFVHDRAAPEPAANGYWLAASDGGIFAFGGARFFGSTAAVELNQAIAAIASSPTKGGYWLAGSGGAVFAFGDARFFGSLENETLNQPIVGMAATPTGQGYWLVASDGGIFAFGDAAFLGSMGGQRLNRPIVGMAATASGQGYWLVASDGGIFAFGDAAFLGSMGGQRLNRPVVGMAATPSGQGYWLVATDGGIFTFGDAGFFGSMGGQPLNRPVVGMAPTPSGRGYWLVATDGGVFSFGSAGFFGSTGAMRLNRPIIGMAAS